MSAAKLFAGGDFRALFPQYFALPDEIIEVFEESDIRICNFEATINSCGAPVANSGPFMSQAEEAVDALWDDGFYVVTLANNHIMDYGEEWRLRTITTLTGIETICARHSDEAYRVKVIVVRGVKIGILSLRHYEFGVVEFPSEKNIVGVAWVNLPLMRDFIAGSHDNVDYLVVFPHVGVENIDAPLPE